MSRLNKPAADPWTVLINTIGLFMVSILLGMIVVDELRGYFGG